MFHETILDAMKLLYDWTNVDPENRHFTVSFVRDNWQVLLSVIVPQEDPDEGCFVRSINANGPHLWHVVNGLEAIKIYKEKSVL